MNDLKVCRTADECDLCDGLEAEIDRMRTELAEERVKHALTLQASAEQSAQIDRLRAELASVIDDPEFEKERLQAEIDRLRAENAELLGWLEAAVEEISNPLISMHIRAILAKTAKEWE